MTSASFGVTLGIMTKKHAADFDARWWKVIDLTTGKHIDHVVFADDETGEYQTVIPMQKERELLTIDHVGDIRLVNTLWELPLAVSETGDPDYPFGVYVVSPEGYTTDHVASFQSLRDAQGHIDWIKKQEK